jgi:hypothetical protein
VNDIAPDGLDGIPIHAQPVVGPLAVRVILCICALTTMVSTAIMARFREQWYGVGRDLISDLGFVARHSQVQDACAVARLSGVGH